MNTNVKLTMISKNIFKVVRAKADAKERKSLIVKENQVEFTGNSDCGYQEKNGILSFLYKGREVLSETESPYTLSFSIGEKEGIYGLGMHQKKNLNHRNSVVRIAQQNGASIASPFFTSTGGYAVLIDNYSFMSIGIDKPCNTETLEDTEQNEVLKNTINVYVQDDDCLVYYVILGNTIDEQIAGYRLLTGRAPMYPKWTYGFFQSREHYKTQEEILGVAREFRKRHIPIDCIVQDWNYWGDYGWNALLWDHKKYPDPEEMIREVHEDLGMKLMLSVWPSFGKDTEITKKLEAVGGILEKPDVTKEVWGRVHDPLNPEAVELIWDSMKKEMLDIGVDAWWLDSTEPSYDADNSLSLLDCSPCKLGDNKNYLNNYAFSTSKNVYERQRSCRNDKRVYILTRSGFAGQQSNAVSSWTGDVEATWETFKTQMRALLGFSASGIPYSTTDIGGFFVNKYPEGCQNPEYRELYTRWFWFGVFSPIFRSHGTSTPREMWYFGESGEEFYDAQMKASKLRYKLMPYIYSTAFRVYKEHYTLMRPLVMDFAEDENVLDIQDSYMFGDALLVSPVTDCHAEEKEIYLPKNTVWYDYFTGESFKGGETVTVKTPIDQVPLFVRGGSILLTCEPAESTALLNENELSVNIYTGNDASTILYMDEDDNYSYEEGNYAVIPMSWDEQQRTFTVSAPEGRPENFSINKELKLYLNGVLQTTLTYTGKELKTTF